MPDQVSWKMAGHPRATIITWGGKSLVAVRFSRLVGGPVYQPDPIQHVIGIT